MLKYKSLFAQGGSSSELFPYCPEANRFYSRVICGIRWPAAKPGFAVVLGEEYSLHADTKYHWLAEHESHDLAAMIRRLLELRTEFKVTGFYGPTDDVVLHFLDHFNREQRRRNFPEFHFQPPAYFSGSKIDYHLNVLKEQMRPGSKRLHLSQTSTLPGYLNSMPQTIGDAVDTDFPGPAALAYAVATLEAFPYNYSPPAPQADYDPLGYR